jgi:hypothetical protein
MSLHSTISEFITHPCPRDECGQISCPTSTSQSPILADLLVDGTLSYMFGSRASEWYFEHLLKRRIRRSLLRWDVPGWPGACFTVIGQAQASESETPLTHHERRAPEARLLDYDVRGLGGTVVPQALWSPRGMSAAKKYVLEATLQWPVFFVREDRTVGISLQEAVKGRSRALIGAQTHAPLGGRCTLHVRIKVSTAVDDRPAGRSVVPLSTSLSHATTLPGPPPEVGLICVLSQWPGYEVWSRQRQARDDTHRRNPITLAKFAQCVGRCVKELLQVYYTESCCYRQPRY